MICPHCEEELIEEQEKSYCSTCWYTYYHDIPSTHRRKEKFIANKLAQELLPKQKVKFRFVKTLERLEYGRTEFEGGEKEFWKSPTKPILISKINFQKGKYNPHPRDMFIQTTTHELAHNANEVRFHPNFSLNSKEFEKWCDICGEPHLGKGHDKIWHDKYLDFYKQAKNKKFIKDYLKNVKNR